MGKKQYEKLDEWRKNPWQINPSEKLSIETQERMISRAIGDINTMVALRELYESKLRITNQDIGKIKSLLIALGERDP